MGLTVDAADACGDVVDGHGKEIEVIDYHRGGENDAELNGAAGEGVVGVGGEDIDGSLRCGGDIAHLLPGVGVETEIDVGTACGVVAVGCDEVVALMQQGTLGIGKTLLLALQPSFACSDNAGTVDEKFKDVIV